MKEDNAPSPTKPQFSPREKLVEVALHSEDNRYFARNIVNRLWARMLGRGLVDPLDQMHSANVPSHPELLDWLTRDLVAHGYDLKRLLRGIALSQTYSRSSEWTSPGELPASSLFAVAKIKPLSPRQYGLSLSVASHNPTQWPTFDQAEQWAICSRPPRDDDHQQAVTEYFEKHSSDRLAAIRQVVWALLTNPETFSADHRSTVCLAVDF